jgi:hypothetical protein
VSHAPLFGDFINGIGQFLPRHLTDCAAALPHKAATPTIRHRGSYGPIASLRTAEKQGALSTRDYADIHDSLKLIRRTAD